MLLALALSMNGLHKVGLFGFACAYGSVVYRWSAQKLLNMQFTVCFLVLTLSCIAEMTSSCKEEELRALNQFKGSFEENYTQEFSSWQGSKCCEWEGIKCHKGRVTLLNLTRRHLRPLSNALPASLFELKHLKYLDLSCNNFSGMSIPSEIGNLTRLTYLDLSHCLLAGQIPQEIGNLTRLEHLKLSRAVYILGYPSLWIANISWIEKLSSLKHLSLDGVDLRSVTSEWSNSVSRLVDLKYLSMSGCRLDGMVPNLIEMEKLEYLDLSYNTFSEQHMPSWVAEMDSLMALNLSGCALRGPLPKLPSIYYLSLDRNYHLSPPTDVLKNFREVRFLSMSSCNMSGELTCSDVLGLQFLYHLDLSSNEISGSIPLCSNQQAYSLQFLDLSFNKLNGSIPSSLGNFKALSHLDLRHNQLTNSTPDSLFNLQLLEYLGLGNNMLDGKISKEIGSLKHLNTLDLSFNNLSYGVVSMEMFRGMSSLKFLHLSGSGMQVRSMELEGTPLFKLQQLSMSSCNIHGAVPRWLSSQHSLSYLDMSNNRLEGDIPKWLWDLPNLAQVNMSSNRLNGVLPPYINLQAQTGPKVIDLHNNKLQGELPYSFGSLEVLDLSNNSIRGTISSEFFGSHWDIRYLSLGKNMLEGMIPKSLSVSNKLEILDMSNNRISGELQGRFLNCSSLVVINLENNMLKGELPQDLGSMNKLQAIHMNNNSLVGPIPASIQNCIGLEILELGNNSISGTISEWLEHLSRLRILVLRNNSIQGSIPREIGLNTHIQILDLSHNKLSGAIPSEIGKFKGMVENLQPTGAFILRYVIGFGMTMSLYRADAEDGLGLFYGAGVEVISKGLDMHFDQIPSIVTSMDLSGNMLQGHIPEEVGMLTGLVTLNLSGNALSGSIPSTVGSMKALESLDVSRNELSGHIPLQLASLDFLQYLNLSSNNLSGAIPDGRHFDTMGADSFLANPHLCGIVINKSCWKKQEEVNEEDLEDGTEDDIWWFVAVGLSFGLGFSGLITLLVACERMRTAVIHIFDSAIEYLDCCIRK